MSHNLQKLDSHEPEAPSGKSVSYEVQKILDLLDKKYADTGVSAELYKKSVLDNLKNPGKKVEVNYYIKLLEDLGSEVFYLLPESVKASEAFLLQAYQHQFISFENLPQKLQNSDEVYTIYVTNTLNEHGIYAFFHRHFQSLPDTKKAKSILIKKDFLAGLIPLDRLLITLSFKNPEQFALLFEKNLFSACSPLVFSHVFQNFIASQLKTLEQSGEEQEDIRAVLSKAIQEFLGISDKKLIKELSTIYEEYYLTKLRAKKSKQAKKEEANKKQEEQTGRLAQAEEDVSDDSTYSRISYSYVGTGVDIDSPYGDSPVHISSEEAKSASEKSLENFLYFESLMRRTKMDFLLRSPHRNKIQIATGVNFFSGEGMSEGWIFSFFSNIARRIEVPERGFVDEEGNPKVGQFYSLGDALMFFTSLAGSGYYKGKKVCDVSRGEIPVEAMLKNKGFIAANSNEIQVNMWQELK